MDIYKIQVEQEVQLALTTHNIPMDNEISIKDIPNEFKIDDIDDFGNFDMNNKPEYFKRWEGKNSGNSYKTISAKIVHSESYPIKKEIQMMLQLKTFVNDALN